MNLNIKCAECSTTAVSSLNNEDIQLVFWYFSHYFLRLSFGRTLMLTIWKIIYLKEAYTFSKYDLTFVIGQLLYVY